jgi:transcriptional regulator with XRE-family HTH domain
VARGGQATVEVALGPPRNGVLEFTKYDKFVRVTAAEILCSARRQAGLSVRQLAAASGVAESRISDYEHGRHQPSVAMLQRLLEATGHDLVAIRRGRIDPERNARVFADVLTFVDAIPFTSWPGPRDRSRPPPPTWSEVTNPQRATR